ncbi:unnamed protein product [Bursaphelenchus xylophilus]|uniref:(pine wood nematode) hypothetical protein n=1 Tax=Bursaphelenchus xylophilus TaxID=6326 RepID=A0A1I7RX59_BURXY|nr:unnamed protein product [Bursaphelenchus xylophilus]CAG9121343.1 unnamed protein product [Bursaphelenchus xylophilus]
MILFIWGIFSTINRPLAYDEHSISFFTKPIGTTMCVNQYVVESPVACRLELDGLETQWRRGVSSGPKFYDGTCPNTETQGKRPSSLTPITVKDILRLGTSEFLETVFVSGRKAEHQQIRKKNCPLKQRKLSRSGKKWVPLMSEKPRAEKRREKTKTHAKSERAL